MVQKKRPIHKSVREYGQGIIGGLLFSFPMLFTMEVWWAGFSATPLQLLLLIVTTYMLLLGYNRYAGMRAETSWRSILIDSVEEMGIGLVLSFVVLFLLNRIRLEGMTIDEMLGKTILEAMAVSIGVSIGTAQLGVNSENDKDNGKKPEELTAEPRQASWWSDKSSLLALSFCGAIIVGGNIAPTEEVILLAIESEPYHILLLSILSVVLSLIAIYYSVLNGPEKHNHKSKLFNVAFDTCLSYLVALVASAMCLWFFGRFQNVSFYVAVSQCIVLGVIATLGASAGRLLIK
ncbi:TIGR02587 family membrane protein [Pontibacter qinzhouensis]|uniref:TIGR02587 family membrane protein n=1 Tax=Pontibacter qinzhouensis TaxID=2603253 RepID=A0A5C8KCU7_9BACT|nr:TIGR02587 family membrane protein [Pontibacter qinzhouensis]TXK49819.1 TIGR02587 family membrane protein [Pontibacter qinzhouensis]